MTAGTDWLAAWFALEKANLKMARLEKAAEDPGVPAYLGGTATVAPVSFVAAARQRIPSVFNLDKLHRRIYELYGVTPA